MWKLNFSTEIVCKAQAMNLQGYWKLAASSSSTFGRSVASLYSCFLLHAAAVPSPQSLIALSASFHHGPPFCPSSGCRRFCWVRRTPPFPRNAASKASLVQDFPCTDISPGLAGPRFTDTVHISFSNDILASVPASIGDGSEGVHNVVHNVDVTAVNAAANGNGPSCKVNAAANAMESYPCDVDTADAFGHPCDGDANMANGPGLPRVAVDCLISSGPCDSTTIGGIGTAPQSLLVPVATPGLEESSVNSSSSSNATDRGESSLSSADKETSGLQFTKTESSRGPQLRRMLNSYHAVVRDLKDERMQWFPYFDQFIVKDKVLTSTQIMQMLGPFMLEDRKERIKRVVANRTYAVCTVVEGLIDLGNIAAIFRSADALGFQSVQVISNETEKRYKKNRRISMGSEKWLDAELFKVTGDSFEELRSRGYRVAVASVTADSVPISDMDWTIPTAVVFGNEYRGVSTEALQLADLSCYIPMEGMVDSFNVSVAAGIVMHHAVNDRKARLGRHGDLSEEEQRILSADFYLRHSLRSLSIIDQMLQKKQEERQTDLKSVLMGDLELDTELREYLKLDLEKVCSEFEPA